MSFYSGCFGGHGMKLQELTLPNSMSGSFCIGPLHVGDSMLMNIIGLNTYLYQLFRKFIIHISGASNQFTAVYKDGIFTQLSTIVAIYSTPDKNEGRINTCLASAR